MFVDHLVFMVQDVSRTEAFYTPILGKPLHRTDDCVVYDIGGTKIFFGLPYEKESGSYNRNAWGLNHWAIGLEEMWELQESDRLLTAAGIEHSPIQKCRQSGLDMIWFDDPDKMRVEFYLRGRNRQLVTTEIK